MTPVLSRNVLKKLKVTVYLQIDNFLQIWLFGSKERSKCDLKFKKNILKKTKYFRRNWGFTFTSEVKLYPLIDRPMQSTETTFAGLYRCEQLAFYRNLPEPPETARNLTGTNRNLAGTPLNLDRKPK